ATTAPLASVTAVIVRGVQNGWLVAGWSGGGGASGARGWASVGEAARAGDTTAATGGGASAVKVTCATCPAIASTSDVLLAPAANLATTTWWPTTPSSRKVVPLGACTSMRES